jgi:2-iminobutanoate/2-iminopropanoate deaminase
MKKVVKTAQGPAPQAPYSQAIIANGFVFVSGQGPIDPQTGKLVLGDIKGQTRSCSTTSKQSWKLPVPLSTRR